MHLSYQCADQQPQRQRGANMADIIDIQERQPHIVTVDYKGDAHVLPLVLVRDIANNRLQADATTGRVIASALLGFIDD